MAWISPIVPIVRTGDKAAKKEPATSTVSRKGPEGKNKRCAKCGELKGIKDFPTHSTSTDGYAAYCRDCKNELAKLRRLRDPLARLRHYTVTRIKNEFPKEKVPADIHTNLEHYLGYKLTELVRALRNDIKAREGISLVKSFMLDYHLDHKKPHSSFKVVEIGDEEFQKCWAIDNLWMIPAKTNLQKGAKQDFFDEEDPEEFEDDDEILEHDYDEEV